MLIGKGATVDKAIEEIGMVVEGINALPAALKLSKKYNVEMPIVEAVGAIVSGEVDISEVMYLLMTRELKAESQIEQAL